MSASEGRRSAEGWEVFTRQLGPVMEPVLVTRDGRPVAVVIGMAEWDRLQSELEFRRHAAAVLPEETNP